MSPLFTEIPVRFATRSDQPEVELWIERGRVRNRRRSMTETAFLIGSADDCDLVLQLPQMPMVHSYLLRSPEGVAFRQLGSIYPISINGTVRNAGIVHDGDIMELGPFRILMAVDGGVRLHENNQDLDRLGFHVVRQLVRQIRSAMKSPPIPELQLYNGDEVGSRSA